MKKKTTRRTKKDAVNLGADGGPVGPGNPPKEHQFKPGQSGNPKGQPRHRTHLWTHICKFSNMTDEQLAKLDRETLTQSQQTALKIVEQGTSGDKPEWERMARYIVDREEGKAAEHLVIDKDTDLTDAECDELRGLIRNNHGNETDK